ncbi:TM2 domain-containing protein [Bacillus gobiensis]|uniref:TM2 domain-containing protein n=1 Tax=Bacillus gobiensis TaxID=1441095 RepID=UPI003D1E8900
MSNWNYRDVSFTSSSDKSKGLALLLAIFGFHYLYVGRIGTQILYWCTFDECGVWMFLDLIKISTGGSTITLVNI